MSCEFSTAILGSQSTYSPSSEYLATITGGNKLNVRNADSLEIVNIFPCVDKIESFEFSPDSCYVLCALYSRNSIQVFSLLDKDFKCRITEGVAGMVNACWSPDSRTIIVESDFGIQLSFWSLVDSTSTVVSFPKPSVSQGIKDLSKIVAYSDQSQYLAVVHRIDLQDYIGVYSHVNSTLTELVKFKARSNDISHVTWMTSDTHIITVDSPLSYKFCVYSPSGENLMCYEAYQFALGVKSLALPPPSVSSSAVTASTPLSLVAIGSFDGKIRLVSVFSWQMAFVLPLVHVKELDVALNGKGVVTLVEALTASSGDEYNESGGAAGGGKDGFQLKSGGGNKTLSKTGAAAQKGGKTTTAAPGKATSTVFRGGPGAVDVLTGAPTVHQEVSFIHRQLKVLPRLSAEAKSSRSAFPPMGVSWLGFSDNNGQYLAAREDSYPRCLWVWSPMQSQLESLLVMQESITCSQWRPTDKCDRTDLPPILAFCTGNSRVYFWTPRGSSLADAADLKSGEEAGIPTVTTLKWSANGKQLLLRSKESHCTCDVNFDDLFNSIATPPVVRTEEEDA